MMSLIARTGALLLLVIASSTLVGCSGLSWPTRTPATPLPTATIDGDQYPDVLAVELRPQGERLFDVAVTMSSPYDTPERYADGWRVLDPDGNVLGTHTLLHDHATEQPFTRTQPGLRIPDGIDAVTVEGRDQANGFGGATVTVAVPLP